MQRLDKIISEMLNVSRGISKEIIEKGYIKINGIDKKIKANLILNESDIKNIIIDPKYKNMLEKGNEKPEISKDILDSVKVLYEDEYIYIINKPAGIIVESSSTKQNTLVDILKEKGLTLSKGENPNRDGIVHRLDKNTSGALIITKTKEANEVFSNLFKERKINKKYYALVKGNPKEEKAKIDMPIKRDENNRTKMTLDKSGKNAVTSFLVLKRYKELALLDVAIETGRTHQIRVHMAGINMPILGDDKYGNLKNKYGANRQMLHAHLLEFMHPFKNTLIKVECEMPEDFKEVIDNIEKIE